jgi:hypothetical protein
MTSQMFVRLVCAQNARSSKEGLVLALVNGLCVSTYHASVLQAAVLLEPEAQQSVRAAFRQCGPCHLIGTLSEQVGSSANSTAVGNNTTHSFLH